MSTSSEKFEAIKSSLEQLKVKLDEVEEQIDDTSIQYNPGLIVKRNKLLEAIEAGEKLMESIK